MAASARLAQPAASRYPATVVDVAKPQTRRFTVDEVLRMVEVGVLGEDEPLELQDGELIVVSPQGPPHATATTLVRDVLMAAYQGVAHVREAKPLVAGATDLPEPDLAVVAGSVRDYASRHPGGSEAWLVVEVARTSLQADRAKIRTYARAGVPVYWLIDLEARRLEEYAQPSPEGPYALVRVCAGDDMLTLPRTTRTTRLRDLLP